MSEEGIDLLVFCVDGQRHALPLPAVQRVVAAVEVTPLPGAPWPVLGAIDVGGRIVPVFSLRRRLGLEEGAVKLSDQFVLAHTGRRLVALAVDEVQAVRTCSAPEADSGAEVSSADRFLGIARLDDGLVLIEHLERFLSAQDEQHLEMAMERLP